MIHIYDNVQCVKETEVMGQYTSKVENNTDLTFTNQTNSGFRIKT
jgi:hypothetical protein